MSFLSYYVLFWKTNRLIDIVHKYTDLCLFCPLVSVQQVNNLIIDIHDLILIICVLCKDRCPGLMNDSKTLLLEVQGSFISTIAQIRTQFLWISYIEFFFATAPFFAIKHGLWPEVSCTCEKFTCSEWLSDLVTVQNKGDKWKGLIHLTSNAWLNVKLCLAMQKTLWRVLWFLLALSYVYISGTCLLCDVLFPHLDCKLMLVGFWGSCPSIKKHSGIPRRLCVD